MKRARPESDGGAKREESDGDGVEWVPIKVMPGDDVTDLVLRVTSTARIGEGLHQAKDALVTTRAGVLHCRDGNRFWVETAMRRYTPSVGDTVIGTVLERLGEHYRLSINSTSNALLGVLAFQGASKRNKPDLKVGALVYARVVTADRDMDPELSCTVPAGTPNAKDWVTGEAVYGELNGGTVIKCSLTLARRLLAPDCAVLRALASGVPFELAVGANGLVWVRAASPRNTILVSNAILNSEFLDGVHTRAMVRQLLEHAGVST